jgi:2-polyprenyl-3-methyl-5-hydroxy-6-metoxy-1,4-benzoquinol methylase
MIHQDNFYLEKESNAFFDRWYKSISEKVPTELRSEKKIILDMLESNIEINSLNVLEVGCFIGDLLSHLKMNNNCTVHGIESSSKACDFAEKNFKVEIENATFLRSKLFRLDDSNFQKFDLIICEDVLSWVSRDLILSTLGVLDWMLKPGGSIFIRDFSPSFAFAFENHHWPGQQIYNYKQAGGHRSFFLQTGKYLEKVSYIRTDSQFQNVKTSRPDSMTWSDSILTKIESTLHPKAEI